MPDFAKPLSETDRKALETRLLPAWLPARRWWRSKSRALRTLSIEAAIPVTRRAIFCVVHAGFDRGEPELYAVPLSLASPEGAQEFPGDAVAGALGDGNLVLDACHDPDFRAAMLELLAGKADAKGDGGLLRGRPEFSGDFAGPNGAGTHPVTRLYAGEQSNTSFSYDGRIAVKLYRRFETGIHPEPEMLRFLRRAGYRGAPAFLSALEWVPADGSQPRTLALAQEFVRDARDAWAHAVGELRRAPGEGALPESLTRLAATLGGRVGELHAALASRRGDPDFAPEPLTGADLAHARASSLKRLEEAARLLPGGMAANLRAKLHGTPAFGSKIRVHGDLHLGQILLTEKGPLLLDFEGEPGRPLAEARRKASPLRDAAGMLRSFHYAAHVAAREASGGETPGARAEAFADDLASSLSDAFLATYFESAAASGVFPERAGDRPEIRALLSFFVLEKALYELEYERNNRPGWIDIPVRGLGRIAG